jgi:metal-responsive CopG/Arc/MetJ family transcriptional regulator
MNQMIKIDSKLWDEFANAATKQRKQPQTIIAKLIRHYLEEQQDEHLFAGMRKDLRHRRMSDEQIVTFVHQYRRGKRARRSNGRKI